MYTLYYSPGAASLVAHQTLIELGAPFELKPVDLDAGEHKTPAYLALNPAGLVPTLMIDGRAYGEAAAMLLLFAERHPQAGLAPQPGAPHRAAFLQGMFFLANTVQPQFRRWFYPGDEGVSDLDAVKDNARQRIEAAWDRLDAQLAHGGYLAGDFSVLDMHATMLCRWSRNMPKPANRWPHISAWLAKTTQRPSWAQVHKAEGLDIWPANPA